MSDKKLNQILVESELAFQQGDNRKGNRLVKQVLQADFSNPHAWDLLHRTYGAEMPLEEFKRAFIEKFYPNQAYMLNQPTKSSKNKGSIVNRVFGVFTHKTENEKDQAQKAPTPIEKPAPPPAQPPPKRVSIQPARPETPPRESSSTQASGAARTEKSQQKQPVKPSSLHSHKAPATVSPAPQPTIQAGSGKIRVLVVDDVTQTRDTIIRALRFQDNIEVVDMATNGVHGIELAHEHRPDVIVMDVNMPDMDGIEATRRIKNELPETEVIILTVQDDVDYMRQAMMSGARDFLSKPPLIEELIIAVERAGDIARQQQAKAAAALAAQKAATTTYASGGKIITIYSAKGGAGCTTLASNLAASLHSEETKVVIVDGDLQFGDVPVFFNIQSKHSVLDLSGRVAVLDADLVEEVTYEHSSGIRLLAPPRPEFAEQVKAEQFAQMLEYLCSIFTYIIVDTTNNIDDKALATLERSDLIVMVTTQDIPSIARTRRFLDLISLLDIDPHRIMPVLNKYSKQVGITPEKVGETLRNKIQVVVPEASNLVLPSVNRGTPLTLQKEASAQPVITALVTFAETVQQRLTELEEM